MVDISTFQKYLKSTLTNQNHTSYYTYLNAVLAVISIYLVYRQIFPQSKQASSGRDSSDVVDPVVFTTYTPETLAPFNGVKQPQVLMAIKGKVYNVTSGKAFYGPGGPYSNFAGRDASRGLAKGSFDEDMLTPIGDPLDTLDDLTEEEIQSLSDWEQHFGGKYILCGELVQEI
ncbi:cytochrome b5-like heme/steroid binding domain-containing protein [Lipomyces japonicus]|uniref:cytochrome b5-like heme/steroid binding domain-containing protein n=1 Tax=Lipomyces japonicus TaxID=56871 RepID=UPI0034CDEC9C